MVYIRIIGLALVGYGSYAVYLSPSYSHPVDHWILLVFGAIVIIVGALMTIFAKKIKDAIHALQAS